MPACPCGNRSITYPLAEICDLNANHTYVSGRVSWSSALMELHTNNWSGEGAFTQTLIDFVQALEHVTFVRVEDARSSRSDIEYNFISNEVFVRFRTRGRVIRTKILGVLPVARTVTEPAFTMSDLERTLCCFEEIGPPDYADGSMLQYLRTDRIVPPYQTRGYKLVELVRVYEIGTESRAPADEG